MEKFYIHVLDGFVLRHFVCNFNHLKVFASNVYCNNFFFLLRTIPCCTHGSGMQPREVNKTPGICCSGLQGNKNHVFSTHIDSFSFIHSYVWHAYSFKQQFFIHPFMYAHTGCTWFEDSNSFLHFQKPEHVLGSESYFLCMEKCCVAFCARYIVICLLSYGQ